MNKTVTRVAVPAHIYIAVETPGDATDEQIIAEARRRVKAAEVSRFYLRLPGFSEEEDAVVYPNYENTATIEDRNWS